MKIVSWNVWVLNANGVGNLKRLLEEEPADVYCLQEVTAEMLEYIHDVDLHGMDYIYCFDYRKFKDGYYQNYFLVLLSKHRIHNTKINRIHVNHLTRGSLWDWIMRWDESIEFQYADLQIEGQWYRIFNCHLEVSAGPELRLRQFEQCVEKFKPDSCNIVCGDFNIYARPKWNWLVWWMMGFKLREIKINEREVFEKRFEQLELKNVFLGENTFHERSLQLDHILVPESFSVQKSKVIQDGYGSDHQPIFVELAPS